jgi:hypothetical protein
VPGVAATARQPRRPESLEQFRAPVSKRPGQAHGQAPGPRPNPGHAQRPAAPAPAARVAASPSPRAIEGRGPTAHAADTGLPDLPGRVVVSGNDRVRRGAAAKRP